MDDCEEIEITFRPKTDALAAAGISIQQFEEALAEAIAPFGIPNDAAKAFSLEEAPIIVSGNKYVLSDLTAIVIKAELHVLRSIFSKT